MTISSTNRKAGPYVGNDSASAFPFSFKVFTTDDLYVVRADPNGTETVLELTTDYTVSFNVDQNTNPGGTINLLATLATDYTLTITSALEYLQPTDLTNNGGFYPKVITNALDRLTIFCQQLYEQIGRSLKLAISVPPGVKVTLPVPVPYQLLGWDGTGTQIVNADPSFASALAAELASGDAAKGSALVGQVQDGAGAVATTVQKYLRQTVRAIDFATGNNSTNDTAAFTALEAAHKGKAVDLLGRIYLVSAVPDGAHYFNGSFRVATTIYPMPRNPLAHPLDGDSVAVLEGKDAHYWPGPVGQPSNDDILIGCYVNGWRHNVSLNAPLICEISYDGGLTWEDTRTVYASASSEPRGLVGGMVTGTRFGVLFVEVDSGGYIVGTKFAYTDNNGVNWTTVNVGTTAMYPHGEFVFDDTGGLNIFGYGGGNIYRARSTDNGATWTVTTAKAGAAPVTQPVEPAVVKVAANKYLMFVRNDAGGNMYASTSTDCTSWTAWVDTGVPLGLNPPAAVFAWGRVWLYLCARRSTPINGWEDKLLAASIDGDTVFAAGGVVGTVPMLVAATGKTAMVGYLTLSKLRDGRFIGYMIDGETLTGSANPSTSRLVRLGGHKGVTAAPALLKARRTQPPITHNPCFNHWTRGTSWPAIAGTTAVADRWQVARTGTNIAVARVEVDDVVAKMLPHGGRYALNIQGDAGGSGRIFMQRFYGKDRVAPCLDRVVTMNCIVRGTLPGYFRARVVANFGSGGSATQIVDMDCAPRSLVGDLTLLTATLYTPAASGVTWGADPYIQWTLISNDTGAANANLYALWWDYADGYIPLDPIDFDTERAVLDKYCQRLSFGGSDWVGLARGNGGANTEVDIRFPMMVAQPGITGDAATNLQVGSTALSAISFDLISPQSARMIGTLSSGTLSGGAVSVCAVTGAGAWSFLADVGY